MKNPFVFVLCVILSITSFTLFFVVSMFSGLYGGKLSYISFICLAINITILIIWNWRSYNWKCTKCGEIFEISIKKYIFSINLVDSKKLHCPKFNKKTICKMQRKK